MNDERSGWFPKKVLCGLSRNLSLNQRNGSHTLYSQSLLQKVFWRSNVLLCCHLILSLFLLLLFSCCLCFYRVSFVYYVSISFFFFLRAIFDYAFVFFLVNFDFNGKSFSEVFIWSFVFCLYCVSCRYYRSGWWGCCCHGSCRSSFYFAKTVFP